MQHVNGNGEEQYAAGNAQIIGSDTELPQDQFSGNRKGDGNNAGYDYGPLGYILPFFHRVVRCQGLEG
jgi:hypothetical protein